MIMKYVDLLHKYYDSFSNKDEGMVKVLLVFSTLMQQLDSDHKNNAMRFLVRKAGNIAWINDTINYLLEERVPQTKRGAYRIRKDALIFGDNSIEQYIDIVNSLNWSTILEIPELVILARLSGKKAIRVTFKIAGRVVPVEAVAAKI